MQRLRILTWHVHGNYLYYLSSVPHHFILPLRRDGAPGYGGRTSSFRWPDNVSEVPAEDVRSLEGLDLILFQSRQNYERDQFDILSDRQRSLPRVYLEHDPPREHPTDTKHVVQDADVLVVHVTAYNRLMWDNGPAPTRVIEHGVSIPDSVQYLGHIERGLTIVNDLSKRGRRLGADIYAAMRRKVPLDLVGMGFDRIEGGMAEIPPMNMARFAANYRFLFNPIRYTSLGLAVCEAMMIGMPIIGLATTEMVTVVENGISGYLATDPDRLVDPMGRLLRDPAEARRLGQAARKAARARFDIQRFAKDWDEAFLSVFRRKRASHAGVRPSLALQCGKSLSGGKAP